MIIHEKERKVKRISQIQRKKAKIKAFPPCSHKSKEVKFWSTFFKRWHGSNAVGRWSRSAEREIPLSALFFLIAFSFAPIWSKEKAAKDAENVKSTIAFFPRIAKRT